MRRLSLAGITLLALSLAGACFEKEGWQPTVGDKKKISDNILTEVPKMKYTINADLEGRATYLGLDVDKETVQPGEAVTLTHYWKIHKPIAKWKLFVHLIGPGAYVNADHKPVFGLYPISQWKVGQIIRDQHTATIPPDFRGDEITVRVGLWQGKRRMKITSPYQDAEDRIMAATLKVGR